MQVIHVEIDGKEEACYFCVVEKELSAEQLRSTALATFTPIHSYLFSDAGELLYANHKACESITGNGRSSMYLKHVSYEVVGNSHKLDTVTSCQACMLYSNMLIRLPHCLNDRVQVCLATSSPTPSSLWEAAHWSRIAHMHSYKRRLKNTVKSDVTHMHMHGHGLT